MTCRPDRSSRPGRADHPDRHTKKDNSCRRTRRTRAPAERFRVTGSGKIRRQKAGLRHNLEHKASKVTRRMSGTTEVSKADTAKVKKLLGR